MANITPILRGRIKDGEKLWYGLDGKRLEAITKHLEGKEFELTLQAKRRKRSLNQNSYYWGVVVAQIAEAAGYTPEEAHDALRWEFLRRHTDEALPTVRSTTSLSTAEAEEYFGRCRQLGAEMYGIYIPEPNEVDMKG